VSPPPLPAVAAAGAPSALAPATTPAARRATPPPLPAALAPATTAPPTESSARAAPDRVERRHPHRGPVLTALATLALAFGAFALRDTASEPVVLGTVRESPATEEGVVDLGDIDELVAAEQGGAVEASSQIVGPPAWAAGERQRHTSGDASPGAARLRVGSPPPPARETTPVRRDVEGSSAAAPADGADSVTPAAASSFDDASAQSALWRLTTQAARCKTQPAPGTEVTVTVTFAPSGQATKAAVSGTFENTPTGACLEALYRGARIAPFAGTARSVYHSYSLR
jgi:hypothetical protein